MKAKLPSPSGWLQAARLWLDPALRQGRQAVRAGVCHHLQLATNAWTAGVGNFRFWCGTAWVWRGPILYCSCCAASTSAQTMLKKTQRSTGQTTSWLQLVRVCNRCASCKMRRMMVWPQIQELRPRSASRQKPANGLPRSCDL